MNKPEANKKIPTEKILCMSCNKPLGRLIRDDPSDQFTFGAWCDDGCMEVWIAQQEHINN